MYFERHIYDSPQQVLHQHHHVDHLEGDEAGEILSSISHHHHIAHNLIIIVLKKKKNNFTNFFPFMRQCKSKSNSLYRYWWWKRLCRWTSPPAALTWSPPRCSPGPRSPRQLGWWSPWSFPPWRHQFLFKYQLLSMSLYFVVNFNIFVLGDFILKHLNYKYANCYILKYMKYMHNISSNKGQLTIVKKPSLSSLYMKHSIKI